ncbi:UNVERIFIED_CONTAM: Vacuolar protein sorting-associated protein 8 [Siphonaria sp. JEL0065]|nr:Vacuolar protein sorting-associated protein 8 [Siphonaria sp. JEL0065]
MDTSGGVQMADLLDVAAGAAWAEAALSESESESDGEANANLKPTREQLDNTPANTNSNSHAPLVVPVDRVLLLATDSSLSSSSLVLDDSMLSTLISLELQFKSVAVDEDSLVHYSQIMIESIIAKLLALRKDVLGWWEQKQQSSKHSNPSIRGNIENLGDWGAEICPTDQQSYQRVRDLLSKIEFELALCQQFRGANAELLRVENILNDDDSMSITSNIISTSDDTHSEPTELPSVYPTAPHYTRSPSVNSHSSLRPIQNRLQSFISPESNSHSRSSSALSGSMPPTFLMNGRAIPSLPGFGGSPLGGPNEVFKWSPLRALSDDLFSNSTTQKFGMPTVFAVAGVIAVGTSRSMILVYDLTQTLKVVLGDLTTATDFGSVTAVAISLDHTKIAVGHAYGIICVWDVIKKQNIKIIQPLPRNAGEDTVSKRGHLRNSKIVHVSFVGSKIDVISADNEGSAFYHSITSMMMLSAITSTQLAGNQPIYAINPLPRSQRMHQTDSARIVAVATPFRLTFMRLKPMPAVFHKVLLQKNVAVEERTGVTSASLAWRPSLIVGNSMSIPALAATFGTSLIVYTVSEVVVDPMIRDKIKTSDLEVKEIGSWESDEPIVALHWINFNTLGLLTNQENIIVLDTFQMCELERCSAKARSILFHDSFSKGLEGLGLTPEMAYFHNFRSYKGRLFILGLNCMEVASLATWNERLTNLVKHGDYKGAIEMGSGFYNGSVLNAVSGLPTDPQAREQAVGAFLAQILSTFVSMTLSNTDFEMSSRDFAYVRELAATSFRTCLMIRDEDLLFGEIYECFSEAGVPHLFLDELEDHILKEKLAVRLNRPGIIQELVNYFSSQGWNARLEQLLVHIDPSAMDINQILRLCEDLGLYSALIYVYNNSIKDYVTPLVSLLSPVDAAIKSCTIERFRKDSDSGYVIFVYLAYIFTGKSFPVGTLTRRDALQAKSDLYNFLFSTTYTSWPPDSPNSEPIPKHYRELGCQPYPYIRLLLQYDAKELFSVLTLAFEDASLDGEIRLRDGHAQDGRVRFADLYSELNRQFIVDSFLMISHSELPDPLYNLSNTDIIQLNIFIAKSYAKYGKEEEGRNPRGGGGTPAAVQLSNQTCKEVFASLLTTSVDRPTLREDRQNALLAMLQVYNPCKTNAERESILRTCQQVSFWRVAELLYKQAGQYEMVIQCYLNDEARKADVFECLSNLLIGGALEYSATWGLKQHVLEMLIPLIEVDGVQTAALVMSVFPSENESIVGRLHVQPKSQYLYLRGLLEYELHQMEEIRGLAASRGRRGSATSSAGGGRLKSKASQALLKGESQSRYFTTELYNLFIQLMIRFETNAVLPFLINTAQHCEKHEQRGDPYDFETVLRCCLDANLKAPALWMLERNEQVARALDIILHDLVGFVAAALAIVKSDDFERPRSPSPYQGLDLFATNPFAERSESMNKKKVDLQLVIKNMKKEFETGLALCQRKANSLNKWERDSLWYRLLDCILEPHNDLRFFVQSPCYDQHLPTRDGSRTPTAIPNDAITYQLMNAFRSMLRKIVTSMVLHIKLPAILTHLLNSMTDSRFGELRRTIFIMLEAYSFDSQLFETANRILSKDAHELNKTFVQHRHKAFRPMKGQCGVCRRLLHIDSAVEREEELFDQFVVFECRHIFHERCLQSEIESKNSDVFHFGRCDYWCVVCEVLNENGVRTFKRDVLERMKGDKGKQPLVVRVEPKVTDEPPINLSKIYEIFDRLPTSNEIFTTLETHDIDIEDRISLNESFDDTDTSSSMHASTVAPITRRVPPRVVRLLDPSLHQFDLKLEPQRSHSTL